MIDLRLEVFDFNGQLIGSQAILEEEIKPADELGRDYADAGGKGYTADHILGGFCLMGRPGKA